jgi:hypothetical protein
MRALILIGVVLILFGVCALVFQGFTYFTQERVVDAGPFKVDVQKPHTIIFHPLVGLASVGAGAVLVVAGTRRPAQ